MLSDYIQIYDKAVPAEICDQLIDFYHSRPYQDEGRLRAVTVKPSGPWDRDRVTALTDLVGSKLRSLAEQYGEQLGVREWWPDHYAQESLRVKCYLPELQHCFPPHVDVDRRANSTRFLSFLIYLNDSDAGTEFSARSEIVAAEQGRVVVFPPQWQWPHQGLKPRSAAKYIASSYLHYAPDQ